MKRLSVVLAALGALLVCAGCSDTPRNVAVKWAQAVSAGDVKIANEYSTGKTYPVNAVLCALMRSRQPEAVALADKFRAGIAGFAAAAETIDGDVATLVMADGGEKLTLRRVDGAWKVDRSDMLPSGKPAAAAAKEAAKDAAVKVDAAAKDAAGKAGAVAKDAAVKVDAAAKDAAGKVGAAGK